MCLSCLRIYPQSSVVGLSSVVCFKTPKVRKCIALLVTPACCGPARRVEGCRDRDGLEMTSIGDREYLGFCLIVETNLENKAGEGQEKGKGATWGSTDR